MALVERIDEGPRMNIAVHPKVLGRSHGIAAAESNTQSIKRPIQEDPMSAPLLGRPLWYELMTTDRAAA